MEKNSLSRRNFLKKSSIIAGGAIIAPTIIPSCVKGANDRILVAHIGLGGMGTAALKGWYMHLEDAYNVATCDPFEKRRLGSAQYVNRTYKEKGINAPECIPYLDMDEIFDRKDIDAVNITTPDHWHVPAAIKAARAGKHIMLAKPLGLSYPNYKILENELKKNDVRFHYGTQQRASSHVQLAIAMVKEGKIGEIEKVDVWAPGGTKDASPICQEVPVPGDFDYDRWLGPAPISPYCPERVTSQGAWYNWDYSIGWLAGWGAHPLDLLVWGVKSQLNCEYSCEGTGSSSWEPGGLYNTINSWNLKLEFQSGLLMRFFSADMMTENGIFDYRNIREDNGTTFFGSKGWISVGRNTLESNLPELQKQFDQFPKAEKNGFIKNDSYRIGQNFMDVIKGKIDEMNPFDEAVISDCISHMGNMAIRTGRKVSWDPVKGEVMNDPDANNWFIRQMRSPYAV